MGNKTQYRATHYNYKAWQIEQLVIPGEDSKKSDPYWRVIKYPGNLQNAVRGMIDLHMDDSILDSVKAIETALSTAEQRIMAALDDLFQSREGDG
jgi:hypothetical protein